MGFGRKEPGLGFVGKYRNHRVQLSSLKSWPPVILTCLNFTLDPQHMWRNGGEWVHSQVTEYCGFPLWRSPSLCHVDTQAPQ